ncbi:MAG: hypothetical protein OXQ94_08780, partial [Gemmatimonadota bacterium]|nr:hypothetical protein [Gemmatimonadota bacterium]MDE2871764.1 hypothetical protein [Gemmatimonadota bacterium]
LGVASASIPANQPLFEVPKCYLGPLPRIVVSAILEGNALAFKEHLARVDGWDYDAMDRTLSLTCSDNTGSEYVLPEELAEVAASLWRAKNANAHSSAELQGGS